MSRLTLILFSCRLLTNPRNIDFLPSAAHKRKVHRLAEIVLFKLAYLLLRKQGCLGKNIFFYLLIAIYFLQANWVVCYPTLGCSENYLWRYKCKWSKCKSV